MITSKAVGSGYVTTRFTANGFITLNHPTSTVGANSSSSEVVTSMNLVEAQFCFQDSGGAIVKRGANTVLKLYGQHTLGFIHARIDALGGEPTSTTQVVLTGNGTVILKFHKTSSMPTQY